MAKKTVASSQSTAAKESKGSSRQVSAPQETPVPATKKPTIVDIELRRDAKCGESSFAKGTHLARIVLDEGVELNYVVDALRGGIAGEVITKTE